MRTMWFKSCYVEPIRTGAKRQTIRPVKQIWKDGEQVAATVGPRPPFAVLDITEVETVALSYFPIEEQVELAEFYPGQEQFKIVHFEVAHWLK